MLSAAVCVVLGVVVAVWSLSDAPVHDTAWASAPERVRELLRGRARPLHIVGAVEASWRAALAHWGDAMHWPAHLNVSARVAPPGHVFRASHPPCWDPRANAATHALLPRSVRALVRHCDAYASLPLVQVGSRMRAEVPLHVLDADDAHGGVWLSSDAAVTNAHYDRSANVLVQVVGAKHVWLWPPGRVSVHPAVHCFYHQTHADPRPLPPPLTLQPGDALFVPPFWSHRIQPAAPLSVSVSLHTPSAEEVALAVVAADLRACTLSDLQACTVCAFGSLYRARWLPLGREWHCALPPPAGPGDPQCVPRALRALRDVPAAPADGLADELEARLLAALDGRPECVGAWLRQQRE